MKKGGKLPAFFYTQEWEGRKRGRESLKRFSKEGGAYPEAGIWTQKNGYQTIPVF
jgi:hypothetical protein